MVKQLLFATSNEHKLSEVKKIVASELIEVISLKDISWNSEIEENGESLEENALIKARTIFEACHSNVFSEDTGLEVFSLNMAPGVHTARYASEKSDPQANMDKLLLALEDKNDRSARFRTVIALIWEDCEYLFEGIVKGNIGYERKGSGGFGYDPIFIPEGHTETFAELDEKIKNTISHRYVAMTKMNSFLKRFNKKET